MYFEKLPKSYQEALNLVVADEIGTDDPLVANSFREWEAEGLLGCEIADGDDLSKDNFGDELCAFHAGWKAREQSIGQASLI